MPLMSFKYATLSLSTPNSTPVIISSGPLSFWHEETNLVSSPESRDTQVCMHQRCRSPKPTSSEVSVKTWFCRSENVLP